MPTSPALFLCGLWLPLRNSRSAFTFMASMKETEKKITARYKNKNSVPCNINKETDMKWKMNFRTGRNILTLADFNNFNISPLNRVCTVLWWMMAHDHTGQTSVLLTQKYQHDRKVQTLMIVTRRKLCKSDYEHKYKFSTECNSNTGEQNATKCLVKDHTWTVQLVPSKQLSVHSCMQILWFNRYSSSKQKQD